MSWNGSLLHSVAGSATATTCTGDAGEADLCEEVEAHSAQAKAQGKGRELQNGSV